MDIQNILDLTLQLLLSSQSIAQDIAKTSGLFISDSYSNIGYTLNEVHSLLSATVASVKDALPAIGQIINNFIQ